MPTMRSRARVGRGLTLVALAAVLGVSGCPSTGGGNGRLERQVQQLKDELYVLQREHQETERRLQTLEEQCGSQSGLPGRAAADPPVIRREPAPPLRAVPEEIPEPREPAVVVDSSGAGDAAYAEGVTAYGEGRFARAAEMLAAFLERQPTHQNAAEARFLLAESYFAEANFPQAIVEYQKVVEGDSRPERRASALYGIGLSYYELTYEANALSHFEQLVKEYPSSPEAKEAEPLIAKLRRRR